MNNSNLEVITNAGRVMTISSNQFLMVLYPMSFDDFSGLGFDLAESADSLRAEP